MDYRYKDERTRKLFEEDRVFKKYYGAQAVKKRDRRLNELASYDNVAELLRLGGSGPGRWHVLDNRDGGVDEGKISGDLTGKYRILLEPPEGDFGGTTSVVIVEIKDTH